MNHMGHVTFLLIFRSNSRLHEKRYRFQILGNEIKGTKVRLYCLKFVQLQNKKIF